MYLRIFGICLEIYELATAYFLTSPGLPWQEELKNTKAKLHLSTDFDTVLMVEKGIRGGICYLLIW